MRKRILVLVAVLMMALSAVAFAHVSGGSINALQNQEDGQKIVIYTQEGYSVALVLSYPADKPMEQSDVIEAVGGGFLTEIGQVYIHDLRSGSAQNLIHIVGVHLSEKEALRWLADGGQFLK